MNKKLCIAFSVLLISNLTQSQTLNIIPQPAKAEMREGNFSISSNTTIFYTQKGIDKSTGFLNAYLKANYGFVLPVQKKNLYPEGKISIQYDPKKNCSSKWLFIKNKWQPG